MNSEKYYCRVCGLYVESMPWGEDGGSPTYEFCLCCGVEYGHEDYTLESTQAFRKEWIEKGAEWNNKKFKPEKWNLEEQLSHIPSKFR